MYLWRRNSYAELHGAPPWFLDYLSKHLSIPVEIGQKPGMRFGRVYQDREQWWGSLLVGNRVPAGLVQRVADIARYYSDQGWDVPCHIVDKRDRPPEAYPWHSITANWRPYQDWIHDIVLREGVGVIDSAPRSGKTLMAARAVDSYGVPVIIIAPSVAIVAQTYRAFVKIFGEDLVCRVDGGVKKQDRDISKPIVIATVNSAVKMPIEFWQTRGMLIIDEFHHAASDTYHRINALAESVYYRLCYTGTHWRTGDDALAMEAVCSRVLARVPTDYLVRHKYLATPYVCFVPFHGKTFPAADWRVAYERGIVECDQRNDLLVSYANQLADQGQQVIVLVNRRAHADMLGGRINDAHVVKGGEGALTSRAVERFTNCEFPVLIGTSVIGEGVDVPSATTMIYGGGLGASVQMMQAYYRPFTPFEGKTHGRVYDFMDMHHPTLQRQAENRLQLARTELGPWVHAA